MTDAHGASRPQPDPATPVGEFVAAHGGDGPGLYAITFGCDGAPFTMDAMRDRPPGDVTTYDIEGLATVVSIDAARRHGAPPARRSRSPARCRSGPRPAAGSRTPR